MMTFYDFVKNSIQRCKPSTKRLRKFCDSAFILYPSKTEDGGPIRGVKGIMSSVHGMLNLLLMSDAFRLTRK